MKKVLRRRDKRGMMKIKTKEIGQNRRSMRKYKCDGREKDTNGKKKEKMKAVDNNEGKVTAS
jgi:hypothetical protein